MVQISFRGPTAWCWLLCLCPWSDFEKKTNGHFGNAKRTGTMFNSLPSVGNFLMFWNVHPSIPRQQPCWLGCWVIVIQHHLYAVISSPSLNLHCEIPGLFSDACLLCPWWTGSLNNTKKWRFLPPPNPRATFGSWWTREGTYRLALWTTEGRYYDSPAFKMAVQQNGRNRRDPNRIVWKEM